MPFLHETWSLVEWIAVCVAALIALILVVAVITNLGGLARYIRISKM